MNTRLTIRVECARSTRVTERVCGGSKEDLVGTSDVNQPSSVFDRAYYGIIIQYFFPKTRRIVEDWVRKTIEFDVPLLDWQVMEARIMSREDRGYVHLFGHYRGPPVYADHRIIVSSGESDGFAQGEKFVRLTIHRVHFSRPQFERDPA